MMNYFYGQSGYGAGIGAGFGWVTMLLLWAVLILGIAALWKYISKK